MRFSAISVALCLVAGVFALPTDTGATSGRHVSGNGGAQTHESSLLGQARGASAATGVLSAVTGGVGKRGLLGDVGSGCTKPDNSCHETQTPPKEEQCSTRAKCPVGPTKPTDCVGIIQSLLRELYPTLDFTAHEVDIILAAILSILGADDLTYAVLHGRIGLLNDLLATLGCTIDELVLTIEKIVSHIAA